MSKCVSHSTYLVLFQWPLGWFCHWPVSLYSWAQKSLHLGRLWLIWKQSCRIMYREQETLEHSALNGVSLSHPAFKTRHLHRRGGGKIVKARDGGWCHRNSNFQTQPDQQHRQDPHNSNWQNLSMETKSHPLPKSSLQLIPADGHQFSPVECQWVYQPQSGAGNTKWTQCLCVCARTFSFWFLFSFFLLLFCFLFFFFLREKEHETGLVVSRS